MSRVPAVLVVACGLLAGGCGESQENRPIRQSALQLFDCGDWKRAGGRTRAQVIHQLREFAGGQVTGKGAAGRGVVLPDSAAARLFDNNCSQRFARGFVLYKLYVRAVGFAGVAPGS